jgi:hypothetical protein
MWKIGMSYTLLSIFFAVGLFGAMLLLLEVGRWIAVRQMAVDPEGAKAGLGAVVGVVFSLLGLLLAFTFSGAASRFDARKQLIVQEVNTSAKPIMSSICSRNRFRRSSRIVFAATSMPNCKQLRPSPMFVRLSRHLPDLRR